MRIITCITVETLPLNSDVLACIKLTAQVPAVTKPQHTTPSLGFKFTMAQPFLTKDLAIALENYTESTADPRLYRPGIISRLSEFIVYDSDYV